MKLTQARAIALLVTAAGSAVHTAPVVMSRGDSDPAVAAALPDAHRLAAESVLRHPLERAADLKVARPASPASITGVKLQNTHVMEQQTRKRSDEAELQPRARLPHLPEHPSLTNLLSNFESPIATSTLSGEAERSALTHAHWRGNQAELAPLPDALPSGARAPSLNAQPPSVPPASQIGMTGIAMGDVSVGTKQRVVRSRDKKAMKEWPASDVVLGMSPLRFGQLGNKMRNAAQTAHELEEVKRRLSDFIKERRLLIPRGGKNKKKEDSDAVAATMGKTDYHRHRVLLNERYKSAVNRGSLKDQKELKVRMSALSEARKLHNRRKGKAPRNGEEKALKVSTEVVDAGTSREAISFELHHQESPHDNLDTGSGPTLPEGMSRDLSQLGYEEGFLERLIS